MRKQRQSLHLNRETLHALTVEGSKLHGVAAGFATVRTCGNPCSVNCSVSCSDCCSNIRTTCC